MKILMIGPADLGPYHYERFRSVVKILPEFTYVRIMAKEVYRPWSSDLGDTPCKVIKLNKEDSITELLNKEKPAIIIIIGYTKWVLLKTAYWARVHGIPSVLQSDSTYLDHPRRWGKEFIKSLIVRNLFDAAFVAGARSASYVRSLGIAENAIWQGVDVVDNGHFKISNQKWQSPRSFFKNYFLTVARLSPEKNIQRLLSAFKLYRNKGGEWGLVIAGTGPSEIALKQSVSQNLINLVYWYGWASYNELPSLYHGASCFILPGISESWGLVVNEAMAAGLPLIVSSNCGCVPELCRNELNGYVVDPFSVKQVSQLMLKMSSGEVDLESMGSESEKIISSFTLANLATTIKKISEHLTMGFSINKKLKGTYFRN